MQHFSLMAPCIDKISKLQLSHSVKKNICQKTKVNPRNMGLIP